MAWNSCGSKPVIALLCAVVVAMQMQPTATAESVDDILERFSNNRISKFNMVHAHLTIATQTQQGLIESRIEAWAKGDMLRNDVSSSRGSANAIVANDIYICRYAGDDRPIIDSCAKHEDVWKHLGMVHPGCVGGSYRGYDGLKNGKMRWLFDAGIGDAHLTRIGANLRIVGEKELKIPVGVSIVHSRKYDSKDAFFDANPNADFTMLRHEFDLVFSVASGGELLKYRKVQEPSGGGSRTELFLNNRLEFDEASGFWYVSRSEWVHLADSKPYYKSTVTVDSIDFSEIDDAVFTVAGLDLDDGVAVHDRSMEGPTRVGTIRNGDLNYNDESTVGARRAVPTESNSVRKIMIIGSLILLMLVIGSLWYRNRSRD